MAGLGLAEPRPVRLVEAAIENASVAIDERFDFVYAYGLRYHLADPESAIRYMAQRTAGVLLLETCVSFGNSLTVNPVVEDSAIGSQSVAGKGCRPTRPWIWQQLRASFRYTYIPSTQPAHDEFPLDWDAPWPPGLLSRAIFIAARERLANPLFLDRLPRRRTRT